MRCRGSPRGSRALLDRLQSFSLESLMLKWPIRPGLARYLACRALGSWPRSQATQQARGPEVTERICRRRVDDPRAQTPPPPARGGRPGWLLCGASDLRRSSSEKTRGVGCPSSFTPPQPVTRNACKVDGPLDVPKRHPHAPRLGRVCACAALVVADTAQPAG